MEFITLSSGKKRQMVYLPEVNPGSFLLFFERGTTGNSWSLRDYSTPNSVVERHAREFGWSATEVRRRARFLSDAPTVHIGELRFWHDYTLCGNALLQNDPTALKPVVQRQSSKTPNQFPMVNFDTLLRHPKAKKRGDLDRMLHSPQSEDWVTWNLLNLLRDQHPRNWWCKILTAARAANPQLQLSSGEPDHPRLEFWQRVSSPRAYELASRERMSQSSDVSISARSREAQPVEGDSEIDVVLSTDRHLIFVEAKLGSDISMRTTYDPCRNQIVRNIDCLLESASGREPFFWMFVRDRAPSRTYCQLMDEYHHHPETLISQLPHWDPETLRRVAQNIATVQWKDLAEPILEIRGADNAEERSTKQELARRI
jgi:hypothetical protein